MSGRTDTVGRGAMGEAAVASYLEEGGCTVCARNFRTAHGELDIVAEDETHLLFVEVKTRLHTTDRNRFGRACAAVTRTKQKHLIYAAETYLRLLPTEKQPRFDVAEVYLTGGDCPHVTELHYLPGAFIKTSF